MAPVGGYDLRAPFPDVSTHPFDRCESAKANNHASRAYSMRRGPEGSELSTHALIWLNCVMRRRRAMLRVLGTKIDMENEDQMV